MQKKVRKARNRRAKYNYSHLGSNGEPGEVLIVQEQEGMPHTVEPCVGCIPTRACV